MLSEAKLKKYFSSLLWAGKAMRIEIGHAKTIQGVQSIELFTSKINKNGSNSFRTKNT